MDMKERIISINKDIIALTNDVKFIEFIIKHEFYNELQDITGAMLAITKQLNKD